MESEVSSTSRVCKYQLLVRHKLCESNVIQMKTVCPSGTLTTIYKTEERNSPPRSQRPFLKLCVNLHQIYVKQCIMLNVAAA